jgi:hypothetical protein
MVLFLKRPRSQSEGMFMSIAKTFVGLVTICMLSLSTGCVTQGVEAQKDKFTLIQPGVTTRALVEQSFGPPDAVDTVEGKTILLYSYFKTSANFLSVFGSLDYDRQSYQFVINPSGKVESCVLQAYHGSSGMFGGPSKEKPVKTEPLLPTTMQ